MKRIPTRFLLSLSLFAMLSVAVVAKEVDAHRRTEPAPIVSQYRDVPLIFSLFSLAHHTRQLIGAASHPSGERVPSADQSR